MIKKLIPLFSVFLLTLAFICIPIGNNSAIVEPGIETHVDFDENIIND